MFEDDDEEADAVEAAADAESVADADNADPVTEAVAVAADALLMMALACEGLIVVVESTELLLLLLPLLLPVLRTRLLSSSGLLSMNAMVGPATILSVAWSRALLFRGWLSDVMKIATGPVRLAGTLHWLRGSEIEKGKPPAIIWQNMP